MVVFVFRQPYMIQALVQATTALGSAEVPIGAVIVQHNRGIIVRAHNRMRSDCDPTAHAEIVAIRAAAIILGKSYLDDCDIYVTLEPCAMCAQAISFSKIKRVYFGAEDKKCGGIENGVRLYSNNTCHHKPEVYGGIMSEESAYLLRKFFQQRRHKAI